MLVSTGTSLSTIHPHDAHLMGVDPAHSLNQGYYNPTVKATLSFHDDQADPMRITIDRFKIINPVNRATSSRPRCWAWTCYAVRTWHTTSGRTPSPSTQLTNRPTPPHAPNLGATGSKATPALNHPTPNDQTVTPISTQSGKPSMLTALAAHLVEMDAEENDEEQLQQAFMDKHGINMEQFEELADYLLMLTKPFQDPISGESLYAFSKFDPDQSNDWLAFIAYVPVKKN